MSAPLCLSRSLAAIGFRALLPVPLLALLALSACSTPQQRAAQAQADVEHMMVVYGPACTRLGYTAGSDPWRSCVLSLSAKDDLQRYGSAPHYYAGYGMGRWPGGWWGPYW